MPYLLMFTSETCLLPVNLLSLGPIHQFWVLPIQGYKAGVWRIATLYVSALAADTAEVIEVVSTDKDWYPPGINLVKIA